MYPILSTQKRRQLIGYLTKLTNLGVTFTHSKIMQLYLLWFIAVIRYTAAVHFSCIFDIFVGVFASKAVQNVACKHVSFVEGPNRSTGVASYPQDVASVAFSDDGRAAAVIARYIVYDQTSKLDVISHQLDVYVVRFATFHVDAHQIDTVPRTDERAGGRVVVTSGVG